MKTLNTMNCDVMVDPAALPGRARRLHGRRGRGREGGRASALLRGFGWPDDSIRDLGGIVAARGLEMYLIFWIGLRICLGHNAFNIRVVT